jgi:hypothetical protein
MLARRAADGSEPPVGERVVGHPQRADCARLAAVRCDALAVLPDEVDAVIAGALPLAGLTALGLLRAGGPSAQLRVLLTGASGVVGHYLTELASATGASITAVSASPDKEKRNESGTRQQDGGPAVRRSGPGRRRARDPRPLRAGRDVDIGRRVADLRRLERTRGDH